MSFAESSRGNFNLMVDGGDISGMRVAPLLKSVWSQGKVCGSNCYDYYTPFNYPCGCLPTGMAQLMYYHRYPVEPNDYDPNEPDGRRRFWIQLIIETSFLEMPRLLRGGDGNGGPYEWDKMVNMPGCNEADETLRAIGAICYDAGIASGTLYTEYGSGTTIPEAQCALLDVFDFANAIEGWNDANNIDKEDLDKMINPNLDAGNPVILGVFDSRVGSSAKHAVMCDGYGYIGLDMYHHLNLGWAHLPTECRRVWYELPDVSGEFEWRDDRYIYILDFSYNTIITCLYNIFTTETGEIISGRIVDTQGEPVEDVLVTAQSESGGGSYTTTSNDKGIYALKGINSSDTFTINAEKEGYEFNPIEVETGKSENNSPVCGNEWGANFGDFSSTEIITIGTGTSSWDYPIHTRNQDSRTQVIYLASEIGRGGMIKSLAIDITTVPPQNLENCTIRMKHTGKSAYSDCSLETDGWTVVYQNNEPISGEGWHKFEFQTPFEYNGTDNLMVDFSYNNSSHIENAQCRVSTPGGMRSVYANSSNQHGDPLDWSTIDSPMMSCSDNVPNVKLTLSRKIMEVCEEAKLIASDGGSNDNFGFSVSISGDYAIVGAPGPEDDKNNSGVAYIFKKEGSSWTQQAKLTAFSPARDDYFGCSVSINENYAVVGAYRDSDLDGCAYIFKREGTNWTPQIKFYGTIENSCGFGDSVKIDGDYIIIGERGYVTRNNGYSRRGNRYGAAYVYKLEGASWIEQAVLVGSDTVRSDRFGDSVSISGDYAVAATELSVNLFRGISGAAYVFNRDGTSWTQQAKLRASDGSMSDSFGCSVSISGDYFVVGATGCAYIFKREGTNWTEQTKLSEVKGSVGDSVFICGDYVIIGAPYDNNALGGTRSGSAYVFEREGTNWTQQVKLTAEDGQMSDHFGSSVSMDGNYIIVGARGDDDNGSNSGSAYIFKIASME
jgi:hypothetical protein